MAYFDRGRQPVLMEFGPVLDLDDVIGGKVAVLASRAAERDYIDVAAALARGYSAAQLTALALALDLGLAAEDFADVGQRLDRLRDDPVVGRKPRPSGRKPDLRGTRSGHASRRASGEMPEMSARLFDVSGPARS